MREGTAALERHDQAQGAVGEMGEGMPGVDGERGHDRQQRPAEVVVEEPLLLGVQVLGAQDADPLGGEEGLELLEEAAVLHLDQLSHPPRHRLERLGRRQAVRGGGLVAVADLPLEARHPHHEELVEVRAEDGEELDALEERHRFVGGLLEHAGVELEPRQLAIDEALGVNRGRHAHDGDRLGAGPLTRARKKVSWIR